MLCFPAFVLHRKADGARAVPGSSRMLFREEKDTVSDVTPSSNGAQRGGAIETAIDVIAAVTSQRPWHCAGVRLAIRADKFPGLAHGSPFVWRQADRSRAGLIDRNTGLWLHSGKQKRFTACPAPHCLLVVWDTLASVRTSAVPLGGTSFRRNPV